MPFVHNIVSIQIFSPLDTDTSSGTAIAACNSDAHLRVCMQDVKGNIREAQYEEKWSNGTEKTMIASAKIGSPIAVASMKLDHVSS